MTYPTNAPLTAIVPLGKPIDINEKAAQFAAQHGSFALYFNTTGNPFNPDYRPWTLELDGDRGNYGGLTASDAIDAASSDVTV
jgi:hypothetical protein